MWIQYRKIEMKERKKYIDHSQMQKTHNKTRIREAAILVQVEWEKSIGEVFKDTEEEMKE